MPKTNLYCFPFAGANKYSYNFFKQVAHHHVEIVPLELPGRGGRVREKFLASIDEMVDDLFNKMGPIPEHRYAIYGHSMGSILGYLVARKIVSAGLNPPVHLFFSGCHSPMFTRTQDNLIYDLPDDIFLDRIRSYGGISEDILSNREFLEYYLPIFRADFKSYETYQYKPGTPLDIPITVFLGDQESISQEDVNMWNFETTKDLTIQRFPGDHFFIFKNALEMFRIYNDVLLSYSPHEPSKLA